MNPISSTAFLTCGARAADAASPAPVCGDRFAALFLDGEGARVFERFRSQSAPRAGIVARHRIIDDLLRARLASNPATSVVIIGAGFDTRAYRLQGGRWTEIDEPQVIALKEARLPVAQCPNRLQRRPIDFACERLIDKLPDDTAGAPVVVVVEGVFVYLDEAQIGATLRSLQQAYPGHTLICDLNTRLFMQRYGRDTARVIAALGAPFKYLVDEPERVFEHAAYRPGARYSVVEKVLEYADRPFGRWLLAHLLPSLAQGYTVQVFEAPAAAAAPQAPD